LSATQKDFLLGVDGYSLLLERGFPLAAASAYLSNTSRSTILPIINQFNRIMGGVGFSAHHRRRADAPQHRPRCARC
jgi:hypothetical protein